MGDLNKVKVISSSNPGSAVVKSYDKLDKLVTLEGCHLNKTQAWVRFPLEPKFVGGWSSGSCLAGNPLLFFTSFGQGLGLCIRSLLPFLSLTQRHKSLRTTTTKPKLFFLHRRLQEKSNSLSNTRSINIEFHWEGGQQVQSCIMDSSHEEFPTCMDKG